jgi:DNA (cytosine-5)-methyltransferase 1
MENVQAAPMPELGGYGMSRLLLNNRSIARDDGVGEEQNRVRSFVFGRRRQPAENLGRYIEWCVLENPVWSGAILASGGRKPGTERRRGRTKGSWHGWVGGETYRHALDVQGLPSDFLEGDTFTAKGKFRVVGNGVPLPMGRAVAKAVKRAMGYELTEQSA